MEYLLVDDDEVFRGRLARAFAARGLTVCEASDGEAALSIAAKRLPQRAVVDLKMPGASGLAVLAELLTLHSSMEVVLLTGYGSIQTAIEAIRIGAKNYLIKPCGVEAILSAFSDTAAQPECGTDVKTPSLPEVEWEHIHRVLSDCNGNLSLAAKKLGLHRRSLQRKLSKFTPQ